MLLPPLPWPPPPSLNPDPLVVFLAGSHQHRGGGFHTLGDAAQMVSLGVSSVYRGLECHLVIASWPPGLPSVVPSVGPGPPGLPCVGPGSHFPAYLTTLVVFIIIITTTITSSSSSSSSNWHLMLMHTRMPHDGAQGGSGTCGTPGPRQFSALEQHASSLCKEATPCPFL